MKQDQDSVARTRETNHLRKLANESGKKMRRRCSVNLIGGYRWCLLEDAAGWEHGAYRGDTCPKCVLEDKQ